MSFNARMFRGNRKPTPLLTRCIELGGETDASFIVLADKSGVRATAKMGEAIATYYVARIIDAQDSMMQEQLRRQEEQKKKAEERNKANKAKAEK